jgi:hypothetical protein
LRVEGAGFRVEGAGLRVEGLGFWFEGSGTTYAAGFGMDGEGLRVECWGFRDEGTASLMGQGVGLTLLFKPCAVCPAFAFAVPGLGAGKGLGILWVAHETEGGSRRRISLAGSRMLTSWTLEGSCDAPVYRTTPAPCPCGPPHSTPR